MPYQAVDAGPKTDSKLEKMRRVFSARLREARFARRLSQHELAKLAGLSQPAVARFELGRHLPRLSSLCTLARARHIGRISHRPRP